MTGYTADLNAAKAQALIEMLAQGQNPGQNPSVEYIEAVRDAEAVEDVKATAEAHRKGNAPPEVGGGPGGQ